MSGLGEGSLVLSFEGAEDHLGLLWSLTAVVVGLGAEETETEDMAGGRQGEPANILLEINSLFLLAKHGTHARTRL